MLLWWTRHAERTSCFPFLFCCFFSREGPERASTERLSPEMGCRPDNDSLGFKHVTDCFQCLVIFRLLFIPTIGNLGDRKQGKKAFYSNLASKSSIDCKTRKSGIVERELYLIFGGSYHSRFDAGAGIGHYDTDMGNGH